MFAAGLYIMFATGLYIMYSYLNIGGNCVQLELIQQCI